MKFTVAIMFVIMMFAAAADAGDFEVKVSNFDKTNINATADDMMEDMEYFLKEPLNWCEVTPVGELSIMHQNKSYSRVQLSFEIKCDHENVRKKFKKFWNQYEDFMYKNQNLVDSRISREYPDYELRWGMEINDYMFIQLHLMSAFGGSNTFNNQCVFFRLKIGDEFETIPFRADMPGSMLKIIATNTIPNRTQYVYTYLFDIPTMLIEDGELDIDVERVWHLVNREKYIRRVDY